MQAVSVLREEHDAVLVVLEQLERAAMAAERGQPVPGDVFSDMEEFFTVFVDRCHHRKEEAAVFPRLRTSAAGLELIGRLEAEHETGRAEARVLTAAIAAYMPGDRERGRRLADAARAYARSLRAHIDVETALLYPAMEEAMADADGEVVAEFDRVETDEIGPGTHERLHAMIERLPARIAPWVKAAGGAGG